MKKIRENLAKLQRDFQTTSLTTLFAANNQRAKNYSLEMGDIFLDYSKNLFDETIFEQLLALTEAAKLSEKIQDLFSGKVVNKSENRPALHPELRQPLSKAKTEIAAAREKIKLFCNDVFTGKVNGYSNKPFTDIVCIGIGGSDLGPKLVCEALKPLQTNSLNFHFISNIDDYPLIEILKKLSAETTLFIVTSKSFTTIETLLNMETAKQWLIDSSSTPTACANHFIAVTANIEKAQSAGFKSDFIFPFWEWIGGRYSLWSSVGLSIALCIGMDNFDRFLAGAYQMDNHFLESGFNENMPVILALLEIWYSNFWNAQTHAIIPYTTQLAYFPSYLQQLVMESNGKSVNHQGEKLAYHTSPIIWGETGTNCQHSFMQLLHQSQYLIPVDFIASLTASGSVQHHQHLLANCISQARVLMTGKDQSTIINELIANGMDEVQAKQLAPHKIMFGNRPSNILLLKKLTPETLGALIALYEHKVFSVAMILGINPFDQWGVEMGKQVAADILPKIKKNGLCLEKDSNYDSSTQQLIQLYRYNNEKT